MNKVCNGCPYKSTKNGICTHKGMKQQKGGKTYCLFLNPTKCEFYVEWVEMSKKSFLEQPCEYSRAIEGQ